MHRITRLLGVGPEPTRMFSGWIAPSMATLLFTAAVSAMTLTPAIDDDELVEVEIHPAHVSLEGVDVVRIVKHLDPEQGEALAQLRELGLDDDTLFAVLMGNDPDPALVKHIYAAAERAEAVGGLKRRMASAHEEVRRQLEAGEITEEAAHERLMGLKRRVEEHAQQGKRHRVRHDKDGEWHEAAEGELLPPVHRGGEVGHFGPDGDSHDRDVLHARMVEMHEHVEAIEVEIRKVQERLERGELTESQATERMAELKQKASVVREHGEVMVHRKRAANEITSPVMIPTGVPAPHQGTVFFGDPDAVRKHLLEAREHVQRALAEGHITSEQAQKALEALQLHEQHGNLRLPVLRKHKAESNTVR